VKTSITNEMLQGVTDRKLEEADRRVLHYSGDCWQGSNERAWQCSLVATWWSSTKLCHTWPS